MRRMLNWRNLQSTLAYGTLLLLSLFLLMPWQPSVGEGLDYAWGLALNVAHQQQLQFGRDILFTYGPLGFAEQGTYYPPTRTAVMLISCCMIFYWTASLWLTAGNWISRNVWLRALALLGVVVLSLAINPWFTLVFVMAFVMVLMPCHVTFRWQMFKGLFRKKSRRTLADRHRMLQALGWLCLMAMAGIVSQMKMTYGVAMFGATGALTLTLLLRSKPNARVARDDITAAVVLFLQYALCWLGAWVFSGQSLTHLPDYLRGSLQIIGSYDTAMNWPGSGVHALELLGVIICTLLLAIGLLLQSPQLRRAHAAAGMRQKLVVGVKVTAMAVLLWIAFKSGIVRQDIGHMFLVVGVLSAITLLLVIHGLTSKQPASQMKRWVNYGLMSLASIGCLGLSIIHVQDGGADLLPLRVVNGNQLAQMTTYLTHGDTHLRQAWEDRRQVIPSWLPFHFGQLTTDIYPTRQDLLVGQDVNVSMRPTLQSYIAANRELLLMNAKHLQSEDAPKLVILMGELPVDGQYPAFADSLSWPWLLTHYDLLAQGGSNLQLKRIQTPRPMKMSQIGSEVITMNVPASVPEIPAGARGIWATIELQPSAWGRLRGRFYKWPVMMMDVAHEDKTIETFRFMPGVAAAGFLLSPQIEFGSRWVDFASAGMKGGPDSPTTPQEASVLFPGRIVKQIRVREIGDRRMQVTAEDYGWMAYDMQIKVTYWRLDFEPQELKRRPAN